MRSRRSLFSGPVGQLKSARSQATALERSIDREAVTTALNDLLGGYRDRRQVARLQEAARQVTRRLGELTGASCSAVSKGPGASVVAFQNGGRDDA